MWAQPLPCSNPTIASFLLDLNQEKRMPALGNITPQPGAALSSGLSGYFCCLKEQIWTAQEGTVRMSHRGHSGDR